MCGSGTTRVCVPFTCTFRHACLFSCAAWRGVAWRGAVAVVQGMQGSGGLGRIYALGPLVTRLGLGGGERAPSAQPAFSRPCTGFGGGGGLCGVVWRGMVCRRRCYQKATARIVLHTGNASQVGCVSKRVLCVVCLAPRRREPLSPHALSSVQGRPRDALPPRLLVWCGVVRYVAVQCGAVWCGVAWHWDGVGWVVRVAAVGFLISVIAIPLSGRMVRTSQAVVLCGNWALLSMKHQLR